MFYFYASIAYTITNFALAMIVYFKARRTLVNQFYTFCVIALVLLGVTAFIKSLHGFQAYETPLHWLVLFLFSLIPFFFLHFMVIFLRQHEIVNSKKLIFLLYFAGLFSYALVLKGFIPGPTESVGVFSADGYIYYITWMSIFFAVGIAVLFSLLEGFSERGTKTNMLMTGFALLMLVLPSPFTQSIYYSIFRKSVQWYGLSSAFSLLIALYLIFRHKIIVTLYDAVKTALVAMNDVFIQTNDKFEIELFRGAVGLIGYTEKQLFHRQLNEIIIQKYYIENYLAYVRNGKMKECLFDADVVCSNGQTVVMDFSFSPLFENDQIAGFVGIGRDVTKRKTMENALRASEARFRRLTENAQDIIYRYRFQPDPRFEYISPAVQRVLQHDPEEFYSSAGLFLLAIHPDDRLSMEKYFRGDADFSQMFTVRMIRKDGKIVWVEHRIIPIHDEKNCLIAMEGIARDITERKLLEEQLRQSQKLESIGTLAGGIAHDFNNLLTIILGYSSVMMEHEMPREKSLQYINTIQKAVHRGTSMVRELLTIARKSETELASTNINHLIEELVGLLRETFPKTLTISTSLYPGEINVTADQNQLQQALLNVCVNARDAMPNGGKILIESDIISPDVMGEQFPDVAKLNYLRVTVRDTGTGMPEEIRQRIFEPFFTTKELGKGTGLGLAVVYSIVKSHRGFITVESEIGAGTDICIYLPLEQKAPERVTIKKIDDPQIHHGSETVLLVEDEELLLQLVRNLLEETGYHVLPAKNGDEAIKVFEKHNKNIDVVLTDMGLPKMGGWEMYKTIRKINPGIKTIFASGYFEPNSQVQMTKEGARFFIQKPYHPNDVLRTIHEAIHEPRK